MESTWYNVASTEIDEIELLKTTLCISFGLRQVDQMLEELMCPDGRTNIVAVKHMGYWRIFQCRCELQQQGYEPGSYETNYEHEYDWQFVCSVREL